jgi:hypothetical protein
MDRKTVKYFQDCHDAQSKRVEASYEEYQSLIKQADEKYSQYVALSDTLHELGRELRDARNRP